MEFDRRRYIAPGVPKFSLKIPRDYVPLKPKEIERENGFLFELTSKFVDKIVEANYRVPVFDTNVIYFTIYAFISALTHEALVFEAERNPGELYKIPKLTRESRDLLVELHEHKIPNFEDKGQPDLSLERRLSERDPELWLEMARYISLNRTHSLPSTIGSLIGECAGHSFGFLYNTLRRQNEMNRLSASN